MLTLHKTSGQNIDNVETNSLFHLETLGSVLLVRKDECPHNMININTHILLHSHTQSHTFLSKTGSQSWSVGF